MTNMEQWGEHAPTHLLEIQLLHQDSTLTKVDVTSMAGIP